MVSKLQVMQASGGDSTVILDVRSRAEYVGEKTETDRAGHIPGAVHVDFESNLDKSAEGLCMIREPDTLAAAYASLPRSSRVITYCNTGTRASVSYLVLRSLGRNVAVYDGAWSEWSGDANLPVVTGSNRSGTTAQADDAR
jgi:thiosulfate/3-mercaptopyruvate sulfurtransferase